MSFGEDFSVGGAAEGTDAAFRINCPSIKILFCCL
jgi:hypothetical protein